MNSLMLGGKLSEGTVGEVYSGVWYGVEVAVKLLKRRESFLDPNEREQAELDFLREKDLLLSLRHPHIVQLLDFTEIKSAPGTVQPAIVLEKCRVGKIDFNLVTPKSSMWHFLRILKEIAVALACAHGMGVVHRDLKPSNILLDAIAEPERDPVYKISHVRAKVSDWGLARLVDETDARSMTGNTGTYQWMAPEVIACQPYSFPCDVFSFGILMYCLASGSPQPYPQVDHFDQEIVTFLTPSQAAIGVVKNNVRPDLSSVKQRVPDHLVSLIEACWKSDPRERLDFPLCVLELEKIIGQERARPGRYLWF